MLGANEVVVDQTAATAVFWQSRVYFLVRIVGILTHPTTFFQSHCK